MDPEAHQGGVRTHHRGDHREHAHHRHENTEHQAAGDAADGTCGDAPGKVVCEGVWLVVPREM